MDHRCFAGYTKLHNAMRRDNTKLDLCLILCSKLSRSLATCLLFDYMNFSGVVVGGMYGLAIFSPLNFKLSESEYFLVVRKFSSKNTKFGAKFFYFGKTRGII